MNNLPRTSIDRNPLRQIAAIQERAIPHGNKLKEYSTVIAILLLFGLFLAHKQDMSIADVGRDIRNGEFFFKDPRVLTTNYYSYTEPDYPLVNCHWGNGVLYYLIWRAAGFSGLHLFTAAVYVLALGTFIRIAKKQSGLVAAGISALMMIPLLALRSEIRPEVFTYLFAGLFLRFLLEWRERKEKFKYLLILLPLIEVLWVNLHLYFVIGLFIIGVFWLDSIWNRRENAGKLFLLLTLTSCATLLNPFGIQGALYPITIFQNYGFSIGELQSVWYFDRYYGIFSYDTIYFKIIWTLLAVSFIIPALKWAKVIIGARAQAGVVGLQGLELPYILFAVVFSLMAWFAIRNMALFGLFSVPILAMNLTRIFNQTREEWTRYFYPFIVLLLLVTTVLYANGALSSLFRLSPETGFGVATGNSSAADFIKKNNLQGPIFNNFDAGGYLIFHLFPDERVFVDNRPEAYPEMFFQQVYGPMEYSEEKWKEIDSLVGFQTIVIARRNMGIGFFLQARMNDPQWSLVFSDPFFVIFIRR